MKEILYKNCRKRTNISKNIEIIEYNNDTMLVIIKNKSNVFSIDKKEFEKIEEELLDYDILLISKTKGESYYFKIKEPNNEIRKAFEMSKKEKIFFGKDILNKKISLVDLPKMIEKIGK